MNKKEIRGYIIYIIILILLSLFVFIGTPKIINYTNNKRYNEDTPYISEIEERTKAYILHNWLKSGIELHFITQELIYEDYLVYYFEIKKPKDLIVNHTIVRYIKTIYKFELTQVLAYKSWQFDRVMISNFTEIENILESEKITNE